MIEKILNLEELKLKETTNWKSKELQKVYDDLTKIGFFSDKDEEKSDLYCKKIFTILKREPKNNGSINDRSYIREDFVENEKYIKSKIYNFDLEIISTCWADR